MFRVNRIISKQIITKNKLFNNKMDNLILKRSITNLVYIHLII